MAADEHARHELYNQLVEQLGHDHARTLMDHLPPSGWGDVATNQELATTKRDLEAKIDTLRHEFSASLHEAVATLRGEINAQTRLLFFSMLAVLFTAVSLAFTAARFT